MLGGRLAWVADPDPGASVILALRFPGIENLGDIRAVDWAAVDPPDILTGGFPCQPASCAGKRKGVEDERWLFDDICAAVRLMPSRPRLLVFENVQGLLSASRGDAMARIVAGLAGLEYSGRWRLVKASDAGAPHRRERWFCLAWLRGTGREDWPGVMPAGAAGRLLADWGHAPGCESPESCGGCRLEEAGALWPVPFRAWPKAASWDAAGLSALPAPSPFGTGAARSVPSGALLPTPDTGESLTGHGRRGGKAGNGFQSGKSLDQVAAVLVDTAMLPTPMTVNRTSRRAQTGRPTSGPQRGGPSYGLEDVLLPTPSVADGTGGHKTRGGRRSGELLLGGIAELLPTPRALDATGVRGVTPGRSRAANARAGLTLTDVLARNTHLLPTPATTNGKSARALTASTRNGRRSGGGQSSPLGLEEVASLASGVRPAHLPPEERLPPSAREIVSGLLPTPTAADGERASLSYERGNPTLAGALLPTPQATDGNGGPRGVPARRTHRGKDHGPRLRDVAPSLPAPLLPTPAAHDSGNTPELHLSKKPGRTQVTSLQVIAEHGLIETGGKMPPTPTVGDSRNSRNRTAGRSGLKPSPDTASETLCDVFWAGEDRGLASRAAEAGGGVSGWGPYQAAVERWEQVLGRPAPPPVEPTGRDGKPQLSPRFVEFMMGLPDGWVTDVPGLSRAQMLKALGNGCVPQQVVLALGLLLGDVPARRDAA